MSEKRERFGPTDTGRDENEVTYPHVTGMDAFVCVHSRDVGNLLDLAVLGYRRNFRPRARLTFVTNDPARLIDFLDGVAPDLAPEVINDREILSTSEMALPGWFRQQIVKLRAYEFCSTSSFCNIGADTVILRELGADDLVSGGKPVLYHTRHLLPDPHVMTEWKRVHAVAAILGTVPVRARWKVDFINDVFCFDRDHLVALDRHLTARHGPDPFTTLLSGLDPVRDMARFGEWTLYSVFVLDELVAPVATRRTNGGYLKQIHSRRDLRRFRYDAKIAHFVRKDFDTDDIRRKVTDLWSAPRRDAPLGTYA